MIQNRRPRLATTLALALCVVAAGCGWEGYPPAYKFPNVKVQFVNERTGWIVGPALLRTQDGGNSWQKIRQEGPGTIVSEVGIFDEMKFQFIDERIGFALGKDKIHKTTDAGDTWTEITTPSLPNQTDRFKSIFFLSATKGWLFGREIFRTDDGGVAWTRLGPTPSQEQGPNAEPPLADDYAEVWFFNEQHGLLVKRHGEVQRTEDGGNTWQRVWTSNQFLLDLHFVSAKDGWLVGGDGFVARTKDSGLSWERIAVPTKAQLHRIFFLNEKKGWAVGMHGVVIYTNDGGSTWLVANNTGTNSPLTAVHFINEKRGWVVGGDIFDDLSLTSVPSNLILETRDGGLNWTPQN